MVCKFYPEQCIVVTNFSLLDFDNFLALNNFLNTVPLLNEVWQVVPKQAFVDYDLDLVVDIASDVQEICSMFEL